MTTAKIAAVVFWVCAMALWSMSAWGPWTARVYEKAGPNSYIWYWLKVYRIPTSPENCQRFLKGVSIAGMVLLSLLTAALILFAH